MRGRWLSSNTTALFILIILSVWALCNVFLFASLQARVDSLEDEIDELKGREAEALAYTMSLRDKMIRAGMDVPEPPVRGASDGRTATSEEDPM